MSKTSYHSMSDGRRIAYRHREGSGPTIVFLPGYMSDMEGGKASSVFEWAGGSGHGCLLLDYSGCGSSAGKDYGGDFADGSLSRWRDEVASLIEAVDEGPVILTGSSMGGWLMLLVGEALGDRLVGMLGIASAPDFTDWGYTREQRAALANGETIFEDNPYGPDPTPTHALFWQDAEELRVLDREIAIDCPVRLLHGQCDEDVPWETSLDLARALRSDDVQVTLIKDGDHRLSRDQDIALLLRQLATLTS